MRAAGAAIVDEHCIRKSKITYISGQDIQAKC